MGDGARQTKLLELFLIGKHQMFLFIYYTSAWRGLRCGDGLQRARQRRHSGFRVPDTITAQSWSIRGNETTRFCVTTWAVSPTTIC